MGTGLRCRRRVDHFDNLEVESRHCRSNAEQSLRDFEDGASGWLVEQIDEHHDYAAKEQHKRCDEHQFGRWLLLHGRLLAGARTSFDEFIFVFGSW